MSDIPFLARLGDELRRATRDDPGVRRYPAVSRAVALAAVVGALAAVLFIVWRLLPTDDVALEEVVATSETADLESDLELLRLSFEEIKAAVTQGWGTGPGQDAAEEHGPYPRDVLDALGSDFEVLYVPTYLPQGYSLYGKLMPGGGFDRAPRVHTQLLKYDEMLLFVLDQYARGFTPWSIENLEKSVLKPVEVEGILLYTRQDEVDRFVYYVYFFIIFFS